MQKTLKFDTGIVSDIQGRHCRLVSEFNQIIQLGLSNTVGTNASGLFGLQKARII